MQCYQVWDSRETLDHLAKFASVHVGLAPYRSKLMAEAAANGAPLTRPLFLHYPHDPTAAALSHEFMMGRDILVAPVLDRNVTKVPITRAFPHNCFLTTGRRAKVRES